MMHYILNGREVAPCEDMAEWSVWFSEADRRVCVDYVEREDADPVRVSTVFLGMDMNWSDDGPPVVFETMVFGGPLNGVMDRYCTWDEAETGHIYLLALVIAEGERLAAQALDALKRAQSHT